MNKLLAVALAATVTIAGASAASARDGCGRGAHRGPAGHCRPNVGPGYAQRPVIGVFYPGRGYWYNNRYYQHRYRHHRGGWRYR